jgi:hypothetical protein
VAVSLGCRVLDPRPPCADGIARSIRPHATARGDVDYGYLWWLPTFHVHGRDYKSIAMYGSGGNKVYVFPRERVVAVVTTTNFRVPDAGFLTDSC